MHVALVPLEGSDHARAALPVARALAELTGAAIRVVRCRGRGAAPVMVIRAD